MGEKKNNWKQPTLASKIILHDGQLFFFKILKNRKQPTLASKIILHDGQLFFFKILKNRKQPTPTSKTIFLVYTGYVPIFHL
jgi:hemin uptake protein HemP